MGILSRGSTRSAEEARGMPAYAGDDGYEVPQASSARVGRLDGAGALLRHVCCTPSSPGGALMRVQLTPDEAQTLKAALDRTLVAVEHELACTDAPSLQHALNRDYEKLTALRARFGFDQDVAQHQTPTR
jgi:hypothetical protein